MTDPEFRGYEPSDHDAVHALHERGLRAAGTWTDPAELPDRVEADLEDIEDAYLDSGGEFLVCEGAGDGGPGLLAMGGFRPLPAETFHDRPDGRTAELKRMRVDPDHHREGVGSALLRELERSAEAAGFEYLVLDTGVEMDGARAFYERYGYAHRGDVTVPHGETLALYLKPLGEP